MATSEVRPVDRARAARMVAAAMSNDAEMFATAVQETVDDDYGFGEMGSTINVFRSLAEDLGAAVETAHGRERGLELVRSVIVGAVEEG